MFNNIGEVKAANKRGGWFFFDEDKTRTDKRMELIDGRYLVVEVTDGANTRCPVYEVKPDGWITYTDTRPGWDEAVALAEELAGA